MYICENSEISEAERQLIRNELEAMYCHKLNVYESVEVTDDKTHVTKFKQVPVYLDVPCRVSEQNVSTATDAEPARVSKQIKVILAPEFDIPAGSVIEVFYHGHSGKFRRTGEPYIKSDTQTVTLIYEDYA